MLDHEIDRRAAAFFRVAHIVNTEIDDAAGSDAEILLEVATQIIRGYSINPAARDETCDHRKQTGDPCGQIGQRCIVDVAEKIAACTLRLFSRRRILDFGSFDLGSDGVNAPPQSFQGPRRGPNTIRRSNHMPTSHGEVAPGRVDLDAGRIKFQGRVDLAVGE